MSETDREIRLDLAAAYRLAVRWELHEGINNHLTARVPAAPDRFFVIPHGLHWSEVTASRLLVVDHEGTVLEGEGEVEPSALFIHSRIFRARPDAACVMHTHQPYATALAVLDEGRLLAVSQNALRFHRRVAYHDDYDGAADRAEGGERLARAMGDKDVLFHAGHGVIVAGPSIAKALDDLYFLERAAKVQILAQSTGRKLRFIADEVADGYVSPDRPNHLRKQAEDHFAAMKRLLDREEPDYRD